MVSREILAHLFIGQDIIGPDGSSRKDTALEKIKKEHLVSATRDFNSDILYARESTLKDLQERLLGIPAGSKKRLLVIKDAQLLKEELREFLLRYLAKPDPRIILVLDFIPRDPHDREELQFIARLIRHARVQRFREVYLSNAFELGRLIEARRTIQALHTLRQLFENGERAERILGGLRLSWQRNSRSPAELKKRLKLLLSCDVDIKTGRLEPAFALERLVVYLCVLDRAAG